MTEEITTYPRIRELNVLWTIAYEAMDKNRKLGTEEGDETSRKIQHAIIDVQWAIKRVGIAERKDAREADRKHRSELIKLMAKG